MTALLIPAIIVIVVNMPRIRNYVEKNLRYLR